MTANGWLQIVLFFAVLLVVVKPLGWYMARVYEGRSCGLDLVLGPFEHALYRLCGVRSHDEMDWKTYGLAMLLFNGAGLIALYVLQRVQGFLPLNPAAMTTVPPDLAFNTAVSFTTNTNWQAYGGESTLSYLTQMVGLTVQNFVSAATGMAILVALIRGLGRKNVATLGNRQATAFLPADGIQETTLADAAQLASLADETPEGRSIVVLAKERYGLRGRDIPAMGARFIPFTAQNQNERGRFRRAAHPQGIGRRR